MCYKSNSMNYRWDMRIGNYPPEVRREITDTCFSLFPEQSYSALDVTSIEKYKPSNAKKFTFAKKEADEVKYPNLNVKEAVAKILKGQPSMDEICNLLLKIPVFAKAKENLLKSDNIVDIENLLQAAEYEIISPELSKQEKEEILEACKSIKKYNIQNIMNKKTHQEKTSPFTPSTLIPKLEVTIHLDPSKSVGELSSELFNKLDKFQGEAIKVLNIDSDKKSIIHSSILPNEFYNKVSEDLENKNPSSSKYNGKKLLLTHALSRTNASKPDLNDPSKNIHRDNKNIEQPSSLEIRNINPIEMRIDKNKTPKELAIELMKLLNTLKMDKKYKIYLLGKNSPNNTPQLFGRYIPKEFYEIFLRDMLPLKNTELDGYIMKIEEARE